MDERRRNGSERERIVMGSTSRHEQFKYSWICQCGDRQLMSGERVQVGTCSGIRAKAEYSAEVSCVKQATEQSRQCNSEADVLSRACENR